MNGDFKVIGIGKKYPDRYYYLLLSTIIYFTALDACFYLFYNLY